jgi:hypothetical protein
MNRHQNPASISRRSFPTILATLALLVLATGSALGATGGVPGTGDISFNPAADTENNHCTFPNGVDANQFLGVSEQFIILGNRFPLPTCTRGPSGFRAVNAGEFYIVSQGWITNYIGSSAPVVYPPDYSPTLAEPEEDLLAKIQTLKVVVDGGTKHEKTYVFDARSNVVSFEVADAYPPGFLTLPDGSDYPADLPVSFLLVRLHPESIGVHTALMTITLSTRHCDGLTTDPLNSCLKETPLAFGRFEVISGPKK